MRETDVAMANGAAPHNTGSRTCGDRGELRTTCERIRRRDADVVTWRLDLAKSANAGLRVSAARSSLAIDHLLLTPRPA